MIKAVIFDLDGTLVYTNPSYIKSVTTKSFSYFRVSIDDGIINSFWFKPNRDLLIKGLGVNPDDFWRVFRKFDSISERRRNTYAFSDVKVIEGLSDYVLGVVTNAPLDVALTELGIVENSFNVYFNEVVSSVYEPKPSPTGLNNCLRSLSVKPFEAVFVGNSDEDILASRNMGITSIIVKRDEFDLSEEPDYIIGSLNELPNVLSEL